MHANVSTNIAYKTIVYQNFQFFQPLKMAFMGSCGFNIYEQVCTYRRQEFQNILKRNYATVLGSYYLLNMELNMILIVLIEFADIRHFLTLQQIWCIPCNLSRWWIWQFVSLQYYKVFPFLFLGEANFSRMLGNIGSVTFALNEIGYCENTFAGFRD